MVGVSGLLSAFHHSWRNVCSFCVLHHTRKILETEASLREGSIKRLGTGVCEKQGEAE